MKMSECRLLYPWTGVKFVAVDTDGIVGEKGVVYFFENLPNGETTAICTNQEYNEFVEECMINPNPSSEPKSNSVVKKLINLEELDWKVIRSYWTGIGY